MDKTKLIDVIQHRIKNLPTFNRTPYEQGKLHAYENVITILTLEGHLCDPVPTIKPGDKVRIRDAMDPKYIGKESIVTKVSQTIPLSAQLKDLLGWWTFSSLEVVE